MRIQDPVDLALTVRHRPSWRAVGERVMPEVDVILVRLTDY